MKFILTLFATIALTGCNINQEEEFKTSFTEICEDGIVYKYSNQGDYGQSVTVKIDPTTLHPQTCNEV